MVHCIIYYDILSLGLHPGFPYVEACNAVARQSQHVANRGQLVVRLGALFLWFEISDASMINKHTRAAILYFVLSII